MNRVRGAHILVVLLAGLALGGVRAPTARAGTDPIGVHSMLQVNSSSSLMQEMFSEASALHAGAIRLDVAPALIFPNGPSHPDFSGLDEIMGLARQDNLRVSADLFTIPAWLADCPSPTSDPGATGRCPTTDLIGYSSVIRQIVSHADPVIHDWEIWNEPDSGAFFTGTPAQYAGMLRTAHDAIKQADPTANVVLGGISDPAGMAWLAQVFATPGFDAAHAFDTANVHERGSLDALVPDIASWRWFLAAHGFGGPLWVTEHGYPADPTFEYEPSYAAGAASQAAYLTASVPTLLGAGASEVFVTERDSLSGQFASEGILSGDGSGGLTPLAPRPAFGAVQAIANCYVLLGRDCPGSPPVANPAALTVPAARIGSSASAAVTVSDPGPGPLLLTPAGVAPGGSSGITVQQDACPAILEPNETCAVGLRFAPATGGVQAATLVLGSDSGPLSVAVTAVSPSVASLTSPQLVERSFAAVEHTDGIGYPQLETLDLTNPLAAPVRVSRITLGGPDPRQFRIESGSCTEAALGPGAMCAVAVLFDPTRVGTAHAELTLRGDGQPLEIPLQATAHASPSLLVLGATGANACFAPGSANRVLVAADEPATIVWHAVRLRRPVAAGCASGASSPAGRPSASGRSATSGTVSTGARWTRIRGQRSFIVRFGLPLQGGGRDLRPGAYELSATASNAHGSSRSRAMVLTVAG